MILAKIKCKIADPDRNLVFLHPWQDLIHPILAGRLAYVAFMKKLKLQVSSGFRSEEEQIQAQKRALLEHPEYYQNPDGRVYRPVKSGRRSPGKDKCMVSAVGQSSHNWGIAADVFNTWMEDMSSTELEKYGLWKPMSYEPWHIEPIETRKMSLADKQSEFYEYLKGGYYLVDIKTFQMIMGLKPDGIVGPKTIAKANEVQAVINQILKKKG